MRALEKVGIVAFVNEANRLREGRERNELQRLLAEYVGESFRPWVRAFPEKFSIPVLRIYGHNAKGHRNRRPQFVGKFINEHIYSQFPDGVLDELQRVNPVRASGSRSRTHHQHLTEGTGNIHLDRQITKVTTLLMISRDPDHVKELFALRFPKQRHVPRVTASERGVFEKLFELEDFE